ncbi:hypothetical protein [Teredinibacter purpureus]|uniref:hypothetical protein n=1 Tax=Teredinibacter purpureus TaxID=2731756 RepID=UPI0005F82687|nr:hypothetical protein [Teredinibacter purpureus]
MQNNLPTSNIAEHPTLQRRKTKVTQLEASQLLENFRRSPIKPISICVNGETCLPLSQLGSPDTAGHILSKEINLWSEAIGHRSVETLLMCFPFKYMQPYELTEIMHALASHFSLAESNNRCHRVATLIDEIDSDHVALLKGLGFNHYQIVLSQKDLEDLPRLKVATKLIRQYAFSGIGIQIHDADCLDDLRDHVLDVRKQVTPDYIFVGHQPKLLSKELETGGTIIFDGENELEDNCIYVGPEGKAHLQKLVLQNFCNPQRYLSALKAGQLPVNPGPLNL